MERTTFLKNYRLRLKYDGTPYEPDRNGPAISYEAVDERTGEPVSVTLIPTESVEPAERQKFEEHVSSAQKLRHANVAKVLDFGREGDDYIYVSERLVGESLASWVRSHGSMPPDAALRVTEQIVSVLSSADFHKLPYPPIQPSDIMLVPGQTAEGTWPLIKVTNFGLPALVTPEPQVAQSQIHEQTAGAHQVTSDRPFGRSPDIRSEIYTLGVTLYFLLTGIALSAEALQRGPKFAGFPKPLRHLLGQILHRVPDQRPKDLLVVTELIRASLGKIERRRALSDRYGIPLRTTVPRPREATPRRLVRAVAVVGVLVLLAAVIAPVVFPDSIRKLVRNSQKPKEVGVLVGVPDSLSPASAPNAMPQVPGNISSTPPAVVSSQPVTSAALPQSPAPTNAATTSDSVQVAPADVQQAQIASAQTNPTASTNSVENAAPATADTSTSTDTEANASTDAKTESSPATASRSTAQSKKKSVASASKRANPASSPYSARGRTGTVRSRVTGITSDGRLILRLPSGRTAIVAPDEDTTPRRRNRVFIDRDQTFGPPPGFVPQYSPDD